MVAILTPPMKDNRFENLKQLQDMYDVSPEAGASGLYGLELNEGLTEKEKQLAPLYASLSRGMMIIDGTPGSGKGTFFNHLAWQDRRLFKGRKVLLDYKPRPIFDLGSSSKYFLFNADFMIGEVKKMAIQSGTEVIESEDGEYRGSKKKSKKDIIKATSNLVADWRIKNEILLQNGIMGLDEFKRYLHNRNPMNPLGIMIGNIISVWRHLDLLIVGMCPFIEEIDAISCIPYMTHHIKTTWGGKDFPTTVFASFYKKQSVTFKGVVKIEGRPKLIKVDGGQPLPEIGVQLLDIPDVAFGNKEQMIVDYLRSNPHEISQLNQTSNLNMVSSAIGEELNLCSERLLFMHQQGIVRCMRFFDMFNSKNYANLMPKMGG